MSHAILRIFCINIILQCIYINSASAETLINADSSFRAILATKDDTNKIIALFNLGIPLEASDTTFCNKVYDEALSVSKRINNSYFECKSLINKGVLNRTHENYDAALNYFRLAHQLALKINNTEYIGKALTNIGNIYSYRVNYEEALKNYMEGAKYLEKINNQVALSLTYGNIGNIFLNQRLLAMAIVYYNKSVEAALQTGNNRTIGLAYTNLSVGYNETRDTTKNFEACMKALNYLRNTTSKEPMHNAYQNISSHYVGTKDYAKANAYCDSALGIATTSKNNDQIALSLILKGVIATETKNTIGATRYMDEAKKFADASGSVPTLETWNRKMSILEEAKGNYKGALAYYKEDVILRNKITNEKLAVNDLAMENKYQSEKKQSQITRLEKDNEIQLLSIRQRNSWLFILIGGLLALSAIGFLFYKNTRRKQLLVKQEIKELEKQKQLVAANSILHGQEVERSRIAKDLHDGLGGMLSGIKMNLSAMKGNVVIQEKDTLLFSKSINQLDNAINEMRRLAHNMVPEALLKFGLPEAIQDYCDSINESKAVNMRFTRLEWLQPMDQSTEVILYRIVQELSNNALKHAEAKNIFIQLSRHEQGITITVEDDGKGFDVNQLEVTKGTGLQNVQSRVDYLKGVLDIQSIPGQGASVNIAISLA